MKHAVTHDPATERMGYWFALIVCAVATIIGLPFRAALNPENAAMLYLVGIALAAARYGRASSTLAAIVSAAAYNFFFTRPYYSFRIDNVRDIVGTVLLLVTSVIIGTLAARLRSQSQFFQHKEQATAALYAMARELASTRGQGNILAAIGYHAGIMLNGAATLWLPGDDGQVHCSLNDDLKEKSAAQFAYEHAQAAGLSTPTLAGALGYYILLKGSAKTLGVLGFVPSGTLQSDQKAQLEVIASVAASALERVVVVELAEKNKMEAEGEKLRNALLSAVSHDFRTPLASIKGVISSLLMEDDRLQPEDKKELLASAHGEVVRLERIISNLLEVTLLESGKLKLKKDYYFLPELVGNALKQTESLLQGRQVTCHIQPDVPALHVDGLLIEQVLVNLLENAAKYTPAGSPVALHCDVYAGQAKIVIEDSGPGIASGEEEKIFDAFHSAAQSNRKGSGLGLTICRGILQAHGGSIKAENRLEGGAVFTITLPVGALPAITEAA